MLIKKGVSAAIYNRLISILLLIVVSMTSSFAALAPEAEALFSELENTQNPNLATLETQLQKLQAMLPAGDTAAEHRYWRIYCWRHDFGKDAEAGRNYASKHLALVEKAADIEAMADLRLCHGYFSTESGHSQDAMQDYDRAIAEATQAKNQHVLADALSSRGGLRTNLGDLASGINDLLAAQRLYEHAGLNYWAAVNLNFIGDAYRTIGDNEHAMTYYQQLLDKYLNDKFLTLIVANSHAGMGKIYQSQHKYQQALDCFHKSLALHESLNNEFIDYKRRELIRDKASLAETYVDMGEYDNALKMVAEVQSVVDANHGDLDWAAATLSEGIAWAGKKQFAKALDRFDAIEPVIRREKNNLMLARLQEARANSLAASGNYQAAFKELWEYKATHAMLEELAQKNTSARMRAAFDTERTESENKRLLAEQLLKDEELGSMREIRRWQSFVLALGAILLLMLVAIGVRQVRRGRKLQILAMTDELTGIANRRHIMMAGEDAIRSAKQHHTAMSILVFDVDFFKRINDNFGHDAGDQVLARISKAGQGVLRQFDMLGRTGGEEFMVLLPGTGLSQATAVAERLRAGIEAISMEDISPGLKATISIGLAELKPEDQALRDITRRADNALYRAKASGRNRVEVDL